MLHDRTRASRIAAVSLTFAAASLGQTDPALSAAAAPAEQPPSKGILPIPDYSGDIPSRSTITGDWGGARTRLANKGIQVGINWTQSVQSVLDGGRDTQTEYGGSLDYTASLDLMRMGLLPGAVIKLRAESRYGDSVNARSGAILPVNTDAYFPLTDEVDEDVAITLTNLLWTQFLSERFAVSAGKIDTLDGDPNEFASGRGRSQFMNANFVFNPALALRLPYSTLAAGVLVIPNEHITISSSLLNTVDSSTTTGFDDFGDGLTWITEADFQYRIAGRPGGANAGFLYSFDQDFAEIKGRFIFEPGEGLSLEAERESWAAYGSAWQYLFTEDEPAAPINLGNGQPDHQGVGIFARAGFADPDTNPVAWAASAGIGGRGIIPTRDNDTFGIGYYFARIRPLRFSGIANIDDHSEGVEVFYSIAITPAARFTIDFQAVESPSSNFDTAYILGARLSIDF